MVLDGIIILKILSNEYNPYDNVSIWKNNLIPPCQFIQ